MMSNSSCRSQQIKIERPKKINKTQENSKTIFPLSKMLLNLFPNLHGFVWDFSYSKEQKPLKV